MDVKKNATQNEIARLSPKRLYSGVKSKVAGNIKSQKKAAATGPSRQVFSAAKTLNNERKMAPSLSTNKMGPTPSASNSFMSPEYQKVSKTAQRPASSTMSKKTKAFSSQSAYKTNNSTEKSNFNSALTKKMMDQIIAGIKEKYTHEKIVKMSQDQLQAEVMSELKQKKSQQNSKSATKSYLGKKKPMAVSQSQNLYQSRKSGITNIKNNGEINVIEYE